MDVDAVAGVREHGHAFQSVEAASGLHRVLSRSENAQVLVVGGGSTGIETVAELADSMPRLRLTLAIDKPVCDEAVPGGYARKATNYLYQALEQRKITLRSGARVTRLQAGIAALSNAQEIAFDACIWTSGFAPPPLAGDAGIQVNRRWQIMTDAFLRSLSHPNIIAIGDAAQASSTDGGDCRMGCATCVPFRLSLSQYQPGAARRRGAVRRPPRCAQKYRLNRRECGGMDGIHLPKHLVDHWFDHPRKAARPAAATDAYATVAWGASIRMSGFPAPVASPPNHAPAGAAVTGSRPLQPRPSRLDGRSHCDRPPGNASSGVTLGGSA